MHLEACSHAPPIPTAFNTSRTRSLLESTIIIKWNVDALRMKASSAKVIYVKSAVEGHANDGGHGRGPGCVNWQCRGPVARAAAYFEPCAAPSALRNRRLCKPCRCQLAAARAGRKSGTRSGPAARAASARAASSVKCPQCNVVSVSLLERWNWVLRKSYAHCGIILN